MGGPRGITGALREAVGNSRNTWRRGKVEGSAAADGREATTSQGAPATPEDALLSVAFKPEETRGVPSQCLGKQGAVAFTGKMRHTH